MWHTNTVILIQLWTAETWHWCFLVELWLQRQMGCHYKGVLHIWDSLCSIKVGRAPEKHLCGVHGP